MIHYMFNKQCKRVTQFSSLNMNFRKHVFQDGMLAQREKALAAKHHEPSVVPGPIESKESTHFLSCSLTSTHKNAHACLNITSVQTHRVNIKNFMTFYFKSIKQKITQVSTLHNWKIILHMLHSLSYIESAFLKQHMWSQA